MMDRMAIPFEVKRAICEEKCGQYATCFEPCNSGCDKLQAIANELNGNIKEQEEPADDTDKSLEGWTEVNEPEHYKHGLFEVIDEMIIMFGVEKTIVFCQLNAWKYRARAPFKGKMEQDMDKANRYLEMAYEMQQIRQEYPEVDSYEVCFLLKGWRKEKS